MDRIKNRDKRFYSALLSLALPVALQNLIASAINMLDTLMITTLGEASLAAVGLANQVFFFYSLTIFGIATGSSVFIAQFWGKRDRKNIKRVLGLSLTIGVGLGIIFTIVAFFYPEFVMGSLTKDKLVVELGSKYLRPVALSYIVTGIAFIYAVACRAVGEAKMPMMVSFIAFITNAFFNYVLIFGKLGFPEFGIEGAAYGTIIARILELSIILYIIYTDKEDNPLAGHFKELTDWNKAFVNIYLATTTPVILNEAFWSLGNVMYSVAYAKAGVVATAAVQILTTVQNLFMVLTRGVSNACTIMIGNEIGSGDEDRAIDYSHKFFGISIFLGISLGLVLVLTPELILKLFGDLSPELFETSKKLIQMLGTFFVFKVFSGTVVVGVLRGGGDTKFAAMLEVLSVWLVGVPLAFFGSVVLKLPVHYILMLVFFEEIVVSVVGYFRVKSNKWVKNIVKDI